MDADGKYCEFHLCQKACPLYRVVNMTMISYCDDEDIVMVKLAMNVWWKEEELVAMIRMVHLTLVKYYLIYF